MTIDPSPPVASQASTIVNKTLSAGIGLGLLLFSMGAIVWFAIWGDKDNSIHFYSNGAAWWTLWFLAAAFGLGGAAASLVGALKVTR